MLVNQLPIGGRKLLRYRAYCLCLQTGGGGNPHPEWTTITAGFQPEGVAFDESGRLLVTSSTSGAPVQIKLRGSLLGRRFIMRALLV